MTAAPVAPVARRISPATHRYRGKITDSARWGTWVPRDGDILVCTPPKCGTTWTQTILSMLLHKTTDLPGRLPLLSPWVDADLGISAQAVAADLAAQTGRRVVKTHTPADGFPVWEGVRVIAVYRHPLDVFFSLRKHTANMAGAPPDHPMRLPVRAALAAFVDGAADRDNFDRDTLATIAMHYAQTALCDRLPDLHLFHYANMVRDPLRAVDALSRAAAIDAGPDLTERVAEATAFHAMKARASDYAPVGGTGFWKCDAAFFDSASSNKWEGKLAPADLARYAERLRTLLPQQRARNWLEHGGSGPV